MIPILFVSCLIAGLAPFAPANAQSAEPTAAAQTEQTQAPEAGQTASEAEGAQPAETATAPSQPPAVLEAGTVTKGGLVKDSIVIHVTNLNDSGEGSLRTAISESSPRIIVFDVAGTIMLESPILVSKPYVTIAGQTAPPPGILLRGNRLRITTHDVVVQHISVRPGRQDPVPNNADAISISKCTECDHDARDILLENVSASWATDENVGLWGEQGVSNITLRSSLIAEALDHAGHEKGAHSMGVLIGEQVDSVEVVGSLFVSNRYRNPVVGAGTSVFVANNYIYNPGDASIHMFKGRGTRASIIGNVIKRGPSSRRELSVLQIQGSFAENYPDVVIYEDDNHCCDGGTHGRASRAPDSADFAAAAPVVSRSWKIIPATEVWDWVQRHAGSRPAERQPIDARIIAFVRSGVGAIIDDPEEVGGYLGASISAETPAVIPKQPFDVIGPNKKTRIEAWLCLRHFQVGGAPTPECSESPEVLEEVLYAED